MATDQTEHRTQDHSVRPLVSEDLEAIQNILEFWMRDELGGPVRHDNAQQGVSAMAASVTSNDPCYVVAQTTNGQVVGVAGFTTHRIDPEIVPPDGRAVEIINVYVVPDRLRSGIGTALVDAIEKRLVADSFDTLLVVSGSRNRRYGYPFWDRRYGDRFRCDVDYFGPGTERVVWRKTL